jgi:hypothetical protein
VLLKGEQEKYDELWQQRLRAAQFGRNRFDRAADPLLMSIRAKVAMCGLLRE